ncbi:YiiX/YebB-like N1pC/P60 family cysteine hydrolase [Chitinophagaceae bacterium MMS25-I14]
MKHLCILLFITLLAVSAQAQQDYHTFQFHTGDLLFQDLDCGGLCDAIEKVTPATNGKHFSHLGLVYQKDDSLFVIEAIGKDVHLTPLEKFLHRQEDKNRHPQIIVGRLKKAYRSLTPAAIQYAISQLGVPYDDDFLYNNQKYYCSELIYDAYKKANHGKPFFRLFPMTFKDPATHKTFPAWTSYYADLHEPIPEGKPGCNPGGIAHSDKIEIVAAFY